MSARRLDQGREHQPAGLWRRLIWRAAAADVEVLQHRDCAGDRGFFDVLGVATLATAGVDGAIAAASASGMLFDGAAPAALAFGFGWGFVVLTVDRTLLAGFDALKGASAMSRGLLAALRIAMAATVAFANAAPAEIYVFRDRIAVQIEQNRAREGAREEALLNARYPEIEQLRLQRAALVAKVDEAQGAVDAQAQASIAELAGSGGTGKPGDGQVHREKKAEMQRLQQQAAEVKAGARSEVEALDARLAEVEARRAADLRRFDAAVRRDGDFLAHLEALADLKSDARHGRTISVAGWVFTLLALFIGVTPLLAKMLRAPSAYDAAIAARRSIGRAKWNARAETAAAEAAAGVRRAGLREAAAEEVQQALAQAVVNEALASPEGRRQFRALMREVLARAAPAARRAVREAYDDETVASEVAAAARRARRRRDADVIDAEMRRARAFADLERAEDAAAGLRADGRVSDPDLH